METLFNRISLEEQLKLAAKVFQHAKTKSAFYKEKFENIEDVESYSDWLKIPFLTRGEVYENSYPKSKKMLTVPIESMIVVSTGGSSGIARYSVLTYNEWDLFAEYQSKAMKLLGVGKRDIVANMFVSGYLWPSFIGGYEVIKRTGAVCLPIGAIPKEHMDRVLEYFELFKPTVLLTLPTVITILTEECKKRKITLESFRLLQFTSEPLPQNTEEYIKSVFVNASIRSASYTSADCGIIGYQCNSCGINEYHIPTDFQLVEIYNFEENRPCEPGEEGEIVVTNLHRFSMPMIRYRLGDVGYIKQKRCSCGDENPLLVLKGRAGDDFKIGGAYVSMEDVEAAISPYFGKEGVTPTYQLVLSLADDGRMNFILRIESSNPPKSKALEEEILESVKQHVDMVNLAVKEKYFSTFAVEFVPTGTLARSPVSGKVKRLIDKRTN